MSELQAYYNNFRTGWWAQEDPDVCICHGSGWALSEVDTWHECPIHFKGQRHPDDYDEPESEEPMPLYQPTPSEEYARNLRTNYDGRGYSGPEPTDPPHPKPDPADAPQDSDTLPVDDDIPF